MPPRRAVRRPSHICSGHGPGLTPDVRDRDMSMGLASPCAYWPDECLRRAPGPRGRRASTGNAAGRPRPQAATDSARGGFARRNVVGVFRERALSGESVEMQWDEPRRAGRRRRARRASATWSGSALLASDGAGSACRDGRQPLPRRGLRPARGALRSVRAAVFDADLRRGARRHPPISRARIARARRRLRPGAGAAASRQARPARRGRRRRPGGRHGNGGPRRRAGARARQLRLCPGRRGRPAA